MTRTDWKQVRPTAIGVALAVGVALAGCGGATTAGSATVTETRTVASALPIVRQTTTVTATVTAVATSTATATATATTTATAAAPMASADPSGPKADGNYLARQQITPGNWQCSKGDDDTFWRASDASGDTIDNGFSTVASIPADAFSVDLKRCEGTWSLVG
ncbi:hypothetical protein [Nakamurella flava]|uniref:hypothetical protein n=1 Tax=Nakamurella flava TaxID=2576308 RepID=UPI001407FCD4|nr:hypothetical protein [Nakamurella flava]